MSGLEDIRARLDAATPAPWTSKRSEIYGHPYVSPVADMWGNSEDAANADFIARAPQDITALLAFVDEVQAIAASGSPSCQHPERLRAALAALDPTTERGA